jgi:hypothetical protein
MMDRSRSLPASSSPWGQKPEGQYYVEVHGVVHWTWGLEGSCTVLPEGEVADSSSYF